MSDWVKKKRKEKEEDDGSSEGEHGRSDSRSELIRSVVRIIGPRFYFYLQGEGDEETKQKLWKELLNKATAEE